MRMILLMNLNQAARDRLVQCDGLCEESHLLVRALRGDQGLSKLRIGKLLDELKCGQGRWPFDLLTVAGCKSNWVAQKLN